MPTLYTSARMPVLFTRHNTRNVGNGTFAKASLVSEIADNHTLLACGLTPFTNFFMAQADALSERYMASDGVWTDGTRTVSILVPPFAEYAEFYFFASKNFNQDSTQLSYITAQVSGVGSERRITHIPAGEDSGDVGAGKSSSWGDAMTGAWVMMAGLTGAGRMSAGDPGPVQLVTSPSPTWTRVDVDVYVYANCYVRAAAYHVLPGRETYTITY